MKTKLEILLDTARFYGEDPLGRRAVSGSLEDPVSACHYEKDGKRCAFGRYVENVSDIIHTGSGVTGWMSQAPDDVLKEEYKGHETSFWGDVQRFHDANHHWHLNHHDNGISNKGKAFLADLILKWC